MSSGMETQRPNASVAGAAGFNPAATLSLNSPSVAGLQLLSKSHRYTGGRAAPSRSDRAMRSVSHILHAPGAQREPSGFPLIRFPSYSRGGRAPLLQPI